MAYYNQIPATAEKMVQPPQSGHFEFPAKTTTTRTLDEAEFYRRILMNYIYPERHEWFVIGLNILTFVFGVLGDLACRTVFRVTQNWIGTKTQIDRKYSVRI